MRKFLILCDIEHGVEEHWHTMIIAPDLQGALIQFAKDNSYLLDDVAEDDITIKEALTLLDGETINTIIDVTGDKDMTLYDAYSEYTGKNFDDSNPHKPMVEDKYDNTEILRLIYPK